MRVIVTKSELEAKRSCGSHTDNPFWDAQGESLVFPDWDAAVAWYLSDAAPNGIQRLKWLVVQRLVPMTRSEFSAAKRKARESNV